MKTDSIKNEFVKVRMDSATLQLLEQARVHVNLDKSKFIRQSIEEKATAIIAEHETTHFNTEDWQLFFSMLDQPPEPTERMKKAAKLHQKIIDTDKT